MTIDYISTRGTAPALSFEDVVLAGLASDGGLYVPRTLPRFSPQELLAMQSLTYPQLAAKIVAPFTAGMMDEASLLALMESTYAQSHFQHAAVAPLKQLAHEHYLLELFHGPTLAFKDFALQWMGRLVDGILSKQGQHVTVIGATSGDTGSAAIAGFAGRGNADIFILHPHGRVSEVQRRQMTSVADANVHNLAIEGTFDDCQDIVKALFADQAFRHAQRLLAVNSINWARILAQVVYYFYAALALGAPARHVHFSVPTGNFGDIYAGHIARRMGLTVGKLIIATNRNDILTRCLHGGNYSMQGVNPSLSPSMDIQVSSNFERLMFELYAQDGNTIAQMMQTFRSTGTISLSETAWSALKRDFLAYAVDDAKTVETIARLHRETGEVLDPHSAIGVAASESARDHIDGPIVTLATAHPAKFPDAVEKACGKHPALPDYMADLFTRPERSTRLPASADAVKQHILSIT